MFALMVFLPIAILAMVVGWLYDLRETRRRLARRDMKRAAQNHPAEGTF